MSVSLSLCHVCHTHATQCCNCSFLILREIALAASVLFILRCQFLKKAELWEIPNLRTLAIPRTL